jgi:hypothetical protein
MVARVVTSTMTVIFLELLGIRILRGRASSTPGSPLRGLQCWSYANMETRLPIMLLHGGPGAAGHMAPVAWRLASSYRIFEPFQRRGGAEPLTVARRVAELHDVINHRARGQPALIGSSWGAMLALAYAAVRRSRFCRASRWPTRGRSGFFECRISARDEATSSLPILTARLENSPGLAFPPA